MASIHWFRKGLRVHDNPSLTSSCKKSGMKGVYPIFILDPFFVEHSQINSPKVGVRRWNFLIETLIDLDKKLRLKSSRLYVFRGDPKDLILKLTNALNISHLTFENDTEPYALARDESIKASLLELSCEVESFTSHTIFDPKDLLTPATTEYQKKVYKKGVPPTTYKGFLKIALGTGGKGDKCQKPVPEVEVIPSETLGVEELLLKLKDNGIEECVSGPNKKFDVPTLNELNLALSEEDKPPHKGGESVGLKRMELFLKDKRRVLTFQKPETAPTAFYPNASTTILSPYLKFGCLSSRLFYSKLVDLEKESSNSPTEPPVSLRGQLMWREFFYLSAYSIPAFDKMEKNPICLQVGWECPESGDTSKNLEAWKFGKTGYPWIDAAMTQLRKEGWIHHLARHAVACFLTRGDLYISWERGAEVFEELLLDADWSLNTANWLWLRQYFRVYSPIAFPKKTDPTGKYIRHFLPQLKDMPDKYIYEPWTAPIEVQKQANCIIGKDYPKPIVDHAAKRIKNLAKMKEAFQESNYGNPDIDSSKSPQSGCHNGVKRKR